MLRWSDQTLLFSVRSNGIPAFGRVKMMEIGWTRLWLRLVNCDRMHPVVTQEVLDLSGVDRTLGGSVRSLPPKRPVSRSHVVSGLFCVSLSITVGHLI